MVSPVSSESLSAAIARLTAQGGDAVFENHAPFARDLQALLDRDPEEIDDLPAYQAGLAHAFSYYYWKWDRRAVGHWDALSAAVQRWSAATRPDLDLLCDLVDFLFFVCWCFSDSSTTQCERFVPALRPAAEAFARTAPRRGDPPPRQPRDPIRIVWLAMFAAADNPMTVALRHMAPALLRPGSGFALNVHAWRFSDDATLAWLRGLGATCHVARGDTPSSLIATIEAQVREDGADIVISDMNNAIPTALFARRLASTQIFLQAGMPGWPVRPLAAVFNSFGFDPGIAGWGNARMLRFNPPWDLAALAPSEDPAETARERATLPQGWRLIGCYGRLVKVTEPYLRAVERILEQCPDTAFVAGGTGDAAMIMDFAARSPVGARIHVAARFVPGHAWGRILDLFLDTWPVTGGEACREVIAKHRPVVTLQSREMPAIHAQRDPQLLAADWDGFVACAVGLLQDPAAYRAACARAAALAARMADTEDFARSVTEDLRAVLATARPPVFARLGASLRRALFRPEPAA